MENQAVKAPMVLIVESDPLLLTGMSAILDQRGYRCFLARNMATGLKATKAMPFDLIVLSFGRDALEAARNACELRGDAASRELPVLFVADAFENAWIEPLNLAGGVYCLPKPFDPDVFLDLVEKVLCLPHLAVAKIAPPKAHFAKDWVRLT
jgi:DNA-binding response OmpR family regulator